MACPYAAPVSPPVARFLTHEGAIGDYICLNRDEAEAWKHADACDTCRALTKCGSKLWDPIAGVQRICNRIPGHEVQNDDLGHGDGCFYWTQDENGLAMYIDPMRVRCAGLMESHEITPFTERDIDTIDTSGLIDFWRKP